MWFREEQGPLGRVAGALGHAKDNVVSELPDSIRNKVTSDSRRESVEHATDAGARASKFQLPEEKAKAVHKHVAQNQDPLGREDHGQSANRSHGGARAQVRRAVCKGTCTRFLPLGRQQVQTACDQMQILFCIHEDATLPHTLLALWLTLEE